MNHSHTSSVDKAVYIVDPDAAEQQRLESVLTPICRCVRVFEDAESFLAQCESIHQGCLIVSALLPEMGVLEVIDRLKRKKMRLPIIVLGEHTNMRLSVSVMRAGAADFIERPFTDRRLRQAVRKAIP